MRFLVAAFGTRGDVQPAMVAARALEAQGHHCECFVPPNLVEWVRGLGLTATGVGLDFSQVMTFASEGRLVDLLRLLPQLRREVDLQVDAMLETARRCDAVLGCSVFAAGQLLADHVGIPYRFLALSPFIIPSREHPSPSVRTQTLPGWLNALTWALNEPLWGLFLKGPLNRRRRALGLAPTPAMWPALLGRSVLLACERSVFPLAPPLDPRDERHVQQLGGLFLEEERPLSAELERFLSAGEPPVYVGFGSMSDPQPLRTVRALMEGARAARKRLVIARGWAGFELPEARDDVLLVDAEPHLKLFPRCAAVVHHGGIGTTHAALRAGVPQLVVPHLLDQFYSAHRLRLAGVGLALHRRRRLDAAALARAFTELSSAPLVERAREVKGQLALDGAARLVDALTTAQK